MLFQIYILSLLCTEDISKVDFYENVYGVYTNQLWKHIGFLYKYEFTSFEKNQ